MGSIWQDFSYLIILIIVFPSFFVFVMAGMQTSNVNSTVIAITPDSQITYNDITFQIGDSTFTQSVSCNGNFHFVVNDSVTLQVTKWWGQFPQYSLTRIPEGCIVGS